MKYCEVKVGGKPTKKLPCALFSSKLTKKHGSILLFLLKGGEVSFAPKIWTTITYVARTLMSHAFLEKREVVSKSESLR